MIRDTSEANYPSPTVAWTTVVILSLTYLFSFMDRQILILLVEPIKADLQISDTQVSLLTGFAFAIIYTVSGIPMGRLADRWVRKYVIIGGVTIWSALTMSCGFASSFTQLFIARMGVGFGEAALTPTAYAMVPDLFPPKRLALAMSVFALGSALGGGASLILSGLIIGEISELSHITVPLLGTLRPWQLVLIVVGGISFLMILPLALIPEPKRQGSQLLPAKKRFDQPGSLSSNKQLPFKQVLGFLWEQRAFYLPFIIGSSLLNLYAYGSAAWGASYFIRLHHWEASTVGITLGLATLPPAIIGGLSSGWLADHLYQKGNRGAAMHITVTVAGLCALLVPLFIYVPSMPLKLVILVLYTLLIAGSGVLFPTIIQMATPNTIRAQVSATLLLISNLVGIGFGPTAIALITDYGFQNDLALGHSIAIVGVLALALGAGLLSRAIKPFIQRSKIVNETGLESIASAAQTNKPVTSQVLMPSKS